MKIIKFNFCLQQRVNTALAKQNINGLFTKLHGVYRHDGLNKIKLDEVEQKKIIDRENAIFKKWKTYLNQYYREWEEAVYSRSMVLQPDEGEVYADYVYYNKTTSEGYELLMRRDKTGKNQVVLDLKTIPFLKDINNTVLKTMRINKDHTLISFVVDLENNERFFGGIYDINNKKYFKERYVNVSFIEFTNNEEILYVKNNKLNRPYCLMKHRLGDNFTNDTCIHQEDNDSVYIETNPTKDNKYLIINSLTKNDSSIMLIDLSMKELIPIPLFERKEGVKYFIDHSNVIIYKTGFFLYTF
jgi:protease II